MNPKSLAEAVRKMVSEEEWDAEYLKALKTFKSLTPLKRQEAALSQTITVLAQKYEVEKVFELEFAEQGRREVRRRDRKNRERMKHSGNHGRRRIQDTTAAVKAGQQDAQERMVELSEKDIYES